MTVDTPPTIELQKGAYKVFKEAMAKVSLNLDLRDKPLLFSKRVERSRGRLNGVMQELYSSRFSTRTVTFDLPEEELTPDALKFIEEEEYTKLKKSIEQMKRSGLGAPKLIKLYPVSKGEIGRAVRISHSLSPSTETNPPVFVEEYKLGCGRYLHTVTFSYRQSEDLFWKSDYCRNQAANQVQQEK